MTNISKKIERLTEETILSRRIIIEDPKLIRNKLLVNKKEKKKLFVNLKEDLITDTNHKSKFDKISF